MARGEQRSNREKKKPKKATIKTIAAAPSQKGAAEPRVRQKEIGIVRTPAVIASKAHPSAVSEGVSTLGLRAVSLRIDEH